MTQELIAKALGISRPTVIKMKARGEDVERKAKTQLCMLTIQSLPKESAYNIEEFLELLSDYGFLSEEGKEYKTIFWEEFIKDNI